MRTLALLLALAALAGATRAEEVETHTGLLRTDHLTVHVRPGSRAAAEAPRIAWVAEQDLLWICARLGVKPMGGLHLYLYDDVPALQALTGQTGAGGFTAGDQTHVPYDNDQTRRHEMVHLVTHQLPRTGDEARNRFFADGVANAVLEYVHGVHVHAVAAFYLARTRLPPLEDLVTGDFYVWQRAHPKTNGYDVAGSFVRFLMDTYGLDRTRRYLTGTPIRKALGVSRDAAEKRWRQTLAAYALAPEVETLLRQRDGETVGFEGYAEGLWRVRLGRESEWVSLMDRALKPDDLGTWTREGDAITGVNTGSAWSACEVGTEAYGNCVVRVRIRTPSPCPIQVRLGAQNQAMLVNGTFLYRGDTPVGHSAVAQMTPSRRETDFVLARLGDRIEVWIDGALALVATAAGEPTPVGIGVHRGRATFEALRVRRLP